MCWEDAPYRPLASWRLHVQSWTNFCLIHQASIICGFCISYINCSASTKPECERLGPVWQYGTINQSIPWTWMPFSLYNLCHGPSQYITHINLTRDWNNSHRRARFLVTIGPTRRRKSPKSSNLVKPRSSSFLSSFIVFKLVRLVRFYMRLTSVQGDITPNSIPHISCSC